MGLEWSSSSPSSKSFPTASPATGKWLLFGMCSLMPLDMLHTPKMKYQCKLICDRGEAERAHLNRLLQYLHCSVFGFCCRPSPFSSAVPEAAGPSMDCMGSIMTGPVEARECWGIGKRTNVNRRRKSRSTRSGGSGRGKEKG